MKIHEKIILYHLFFFSDFQLRFYCLHYLTYAIPASTVTDDVTKVVIPKIFNTNL